MSAREEAMLDRAAKRVEWSARALAAAADDLLQAGEHGAVVNGTAAEAGAEAERCAELARRIAADRELSAGERRVRDGL